MSASTASITAGQSADDTRPSVDAVIAIFNELPEHVLRTAQPCIAQSFPIAHIRIVDDGSVTPFQLPAGSDSRIEILRLSDNGGVSRARNAAIANSDADFVLCLNAEVDLPSDWLEKMIRFLVDHPNVGAACGRILPNGNSIYSQWRMRYQEQPYERSSGSHAIDFATGHAVVFRRKALAEVGGYDEKLAFTEDHDICRKLKAIGLSTWVVDGCVSQSLQHDEPMQLAKKQLRHSGWMNRRGTFTDVRAIRRLPATLTTMRDLLIGLGRDLLKGRWQLLWADLVVAGCALRIVWLVPTK
ncbi:MAG TPA: glycosyltransferase family 2 protein [Humisphaera sp.]|nr:glycosyltransferase family 2 protein [Humisphaera sp.]